MKKSDLITNGIAIMLSCILLSSCNNEDLFEKNQSENTCDEICFGVSTSDNQKSRGNDNAGVNEYTSDRFVLRSNDSADTLCVRTIISDNITPSALDANKAVTRGTPITGDNFTEFKVLTYWTKNGEVVNDNFFMNEVVTKGNGDIWNCEHTYYWPGEDYTLQFCAWAPTNVFSSIPTTQGAKNFEYTVPDLATEQQDILVANSGEIQGNSNQVQPLDFKHICTAIKFVTGSQMQPGTIKSVSLEGVYYQGTYDMSVPQWNLDNEVKTFTQELNEKMTGTESDGSEITLLSGTFMMLPQTLPKNAKIQVIFQDNTTGKERILEAPIAGTEWPQGKTVTYKLSITPDFEFKLDDADKDKVLDAHFEIFKTNLIVTGVPDGQSWTITAPIFGEGTLNAVTIQDQNQMNTYSARQGFWTDRNFDDQGNDAGSARGESTYNGTGSGTFPIAVFVPENVGNATRDIKLTIQVNGNNTNQTITFQQLSPSWFGNLGCERIEGTPAPWGFYWSNNYKLIYDVKGCSDNDRKSLRQYIEWSKALKEMSTWPIIGYIIERIFGENIPDLYYVFLEKSGDFRGAGGIADKITINLGMLEAAGIALSTTDGQNNTKEIYNYEGIQYANTIISRIENCPGFKKSSEGTGTNPSYNATIACMKLNSWNIYKAQDEYLLRLTNEDRNPSWYLPASGEVSGITDIEEHQLQGEYWSSTAENNNQNAFKYSADGTIMPELRNTELNVRAVRKKP